jgi:hypothetical protein
MSPDSPASARRTPDPRLPVRASRLLQVRAVWVIPLVTSPAVSGLLHLEVLTLPEAEQAWAAAACTRRW